MSHNYKGFSANLNADEEEIILCFKGRQEVACPVSNNLSLEETVKIIRLLKTKNILIGVGPFKLTKLGKRLLKNL